MTDIIRISPSGPELVYPATESGKVLTVTAAGNVTPQPNGAGSGGFPAPATSHIIFVSPASPGGWGSDTTGDGTETKPYATFAHAQSVIVAPSITNVWEIVALPGDYTENVALLAFTRIMGFDTSASQAAVQSVRLAGNITLGAGFGANLAFAAISNVYIDGDVTLDYPTATSPTGSVSFTNCNTAGTTLITQDVVNVTEYHACTFENGVASSGGTTNWIGSAGTSDSSQLHVAGRAGTPTLFQASGGGWAGDVHADQNAIANQTVTLNLFGFSTGSVRLTAAASQNPVVNAALGATPENPTLDGSTAFALSPQMRVWQNLTVPSGVVIEGSSSEDVPILISGGVLGATSIETMTCMFTPQGANWGTELAAKQISWSFYVRQNGTASEVHVALFNPGAQVTTGAALNLLFYAFLPTIPVVP